MNSISKMSSGKRRNPLNLSLPPTVSEEGVIGDGIVIEAESLNAQIGTKEAAVAANNAKGMTALDTQLRQLSLSGTQIQRMNEWITQKKQVYHRSVS